MILHCAHQQSPSGGPDDITGPVPVAITPSEESVNVKRTTTIEITFSEWILPTSAKGVSVYPSVPFKVSIKGKRLRIKPQKPLADSTTYHCTITSLLKDLHNNSISQPITIVFSTGPTLDSGKITGCVSDPQRELLQPNVALFRQPQHRDDSGYCGAPHYLVQTDSNGTYSFSHIRNGSYTLLAYLDKNSDYHLQHGSEELYLSADSTITITGKKQITADLYPSTFDTSRQTIVSLATINNQTIIGTWKRPYDSLQIHTPPTFSLEPFDTPSTAIPAVFKQREATTQFFVLPKHPLDSVPYRVIFSMQSIFDTANVSDTLRVDGAGQADTTAPTLLQTLPNRPCGLSTKLMLIWSEPVQVIDTLVFIDTLSSEICMFFGDTSYSDTLRFIPEHHLQAGHTYRSVLFASDGHDLRNNSLATKDSTDTAAIIIISVLHPDSLALSLSGTSPCLQKSIARKWSFSPLNGKTTETVRDNNNTFRFDSIPSGKGRITTFIDFNNNDRPDPGQLIPFISPEPFVTFSDTIEARARWDVEGILLSPCISCEQKRLLSEKKASEARADSLKKAKK